MCVNCHKIAKLTGVYYYWTKEIQNMHGYDNRRHLGFLAQDVHEALPEAVNSVLEDKYLGVDYPAMVPLLTEGMNEIHDLQKDLEFDVRQLHEKLTATVNESQKIRELHEKYHEELATESDKKTKALEALVAQLMSRVKALETQV